jgi:CPA1 family monovalent cation:H+ antiporter
VEWFEYHIEDGPIEIAFSILIPYAAYLAAEAIRGSGVFAVVACGLYLSRKSARFFSPQVRLQAWAFWDSFTFILNGFVFVLIGLQLPYVLAGIHDISLRQAIVYGLIFTAIVIALRLLWTFPGARVSYWIRSRLLQQHYTRPAARQTFVVGWTGMRGVIALAAALSLPERLANGDPFPQRSLIIFLTFIVIFVTLVLQGLTLPWIIRKLGLAHAAGPNCEEREARRIIAQTVLDRIEEARAQDRPEFAPIYDDLNHHYRHRLAAARTGQQPDTNDMSEHIVRAQDLSLELLRTERETALALRSEGRISDDVLRTLEYDLDLREAQLTPIAEDAA